MAKWMGRSRYLSEGACTSSCDCCLRGKVVAGAPHLLSLPKHHCLCTYCLFIVHFTVTQYLAVILLSCRTGLSVCHPNIFGGTLDNQQTRLEITNLDVAVHLLISLGIAKFTLKVLVLIAGSFDFTQVCAV